jgi:hypothetical protein
MPNERPREALAVPEMDAILQQLETLVTVLEHDRTASTFYLFVLLAQELALAKKAGYALPQIRRCLTLAQHMLPLRDQLTDAGGRWTPLRDVLELLQGEATRLATLYGVVRPTSLTVRRELQHAFRTAYTQATGKPYQKYGFAWTTKERTTITTFWEDALRTACTRFQATGTVEALDAVMACLPVWADRHHERWSATHAWREPTAKDVMGMVTEYLQVCTACLEPIAQLAHTAVTDTPGVDPAQITQEVEAQHATQVQALRAQLSALPLPKDTPKAQQALVRKQKAQLTQELQALLQAQEAEIVRRLKRHANARHKLDTLVKTVSGYPDTVVQKIGKASIDVLPRMVWIYDYDRQGDADWRAAKREAKRFVRQLRQASAPPVAVP